MPYAFTRVQSVESPDVEDFAALNPSDGGMAYYSPTTRWTETPSQSYGRSLLNTSSEATLKALINLEIGTDVQAYDPDLTTWAGITPGTNWAALLAAARPTTAAGYSIANGSVLDATTASFLTADETKLDGIEALADVTDAANVAAAGAVMYCATYAEMTALAANRLAAGRVVYVRSRATANDKGHGHFEVVAGTALTANGGTILTHDSLSFQFRRLYVGDPLASWFPIVGDGSTDDTTALDGAVDAAYAVGRRLNMNIAGPILTDRLVFTTATGLANFRGLYSDNGCTIKIKNGSYVAPNDVMVHSDDCAYVFWFKNIHLDLSLVTTTNIFGLGIVDATAGHHVEGSKITGACLYDFYFKNTVNGYANDNEVVGTTGNQVAFYQEGSSSLRNYYGRGKVSGVSTYGCHITQGSGHIIRDYQTDNVTGSFAQSMAGVTDGKIIGGIDTNSSHEARQFTNTVRCVSFGGTFSWDSSHGVDAAMSLHGKDGLTCEDSHHFDHTAKNSFACAGLIADDCLRCSIHDIHSTDCAVRGTADATPLTAAFVTMFCITTVETGADAVGNSIYNCTGIANSTVTNGYAEFNAGSGATISGSRVWGMRLSGSFTNVYGDVMTDTLVWSQDWESYTPTITALSGTLTTTSATARYLRKGAQIDIYADITITTNGTGASGVIFTLPTDCNAITNGGQGTGRGDGASGLQQQVAISGTGGLIRNYAGGHPGSDGEVLRISGSYRKAVA